MVGWAPQSPSTERDRTARSATKRGEMCFGVDLAGRAGGSSSRISDTSHPFVLNAAFSLDSCVR